MEKLLRYPLSRNGGENMSKIRILIADDIEETRNVIKKILTMEPNLPVFVVENV